MKKLKLNVEDLAVDSHDMAPIEGSRGTVNGADVSNTSEYCGATMFKYIWNRTWLKEA